MTRGLFQMIWTGRPTWEGNSELKFELYEWRILLTLCVRVLCLCVCLHTTYALLVARRRCQLPWNWSCRVLWAAKQGLESNLGSSEEQTVHLTAEQTLQSREWTVLWEIWAKHIWTRTTQYKLDLLDEQKQQSGWNTVGKGQSERRKRIM